MLKSILLAAAVAASAASAGATPVPDATYYYHFAGEDEKDVQAGTYSSGGATVTFGLTPSPSINVHATLGDVSAGLKYYFRINGPDTVFVPILIQGKLRADSSAPDDGQANSAAQIDVYGVFSSPGDHIEHDAGGFNGGSTSLDPLLSTVVYANSNVLVWLRAITYASNKGTGFALADPIISIDPSFAAYDPDYASHYSLEFSRGAGNGPVGGTVPEPAVWALMLGGFGLTGSAMRRRGGVRVAG